MAGIHTRQSLRGVARGRIDSALRNRSVNRSTMGVNMDSKRDRAMSPWDWTVIGLTMATFVVWAFMKKSAEEVGSWGPKKKSNS